MAYLDDIKNGIKTTLTGLALTFRHLRQATRSRTPMGVAAATYFDQQTGIVTLQYPHEHFPIPDNGRYRLHNEMDDCIVCDKCAKVCPVDCITIDPIKATGEVGRASDGSPIRLYAETFDIDMAKCCFCGLCTVVCPTECLTMEKTFDFSEFELGRLTYHFANLTADEATEKRDLYEQFVREKDELKARQTAMKAASTPADASTLAQKPKPAGFRPTAKPLPTEPVAEAAALEPPPTADAVAPTAELELTPVSRPKPVFRPTLKPAVPKPVPAGEDRALPEPATPEPPATLPEIIPPAAAEPTAPKPRTPFRPTQKPAASTSDVSHTSTEGSRLHPVTDPTPAEAQQIALEGLIDTTKGTEPMTDAEKTAVAPASPVSKKTAFRPTMKPKGSANSDAPPVP